MDRAWRLGRGGYAAIVRDWRGSFVGAMAVPMTGGAEPEHAEAKCSSSRCRAYGAQRCGWDCLC